MVCPQTSAAKKLAVLEEWDGVSLDCPRKRGAVEAPENFSENNLNFRKNGVCFRYEKHQSPQISFYTPGSGSYAGGSLSCLPEVRRNARPRGYRDVRDVSVLQHSSGLLRGAGGFYSRAHHRPLGECGERLQGGSARRKLTGVVDEPDLTADSSSLSPRALSGGFFSVAVFRKRDDRAG